MQTQWGQWILDMGAHVLHHTEGCYDVDLDQMNTSAEMLNWIFQITGKTWATKEDLGDFLHALDYLLNPQGNLCGSGFPKEINAFELLSRRFGQPVS
jgi:hypothetical protein